MADAFPMIAACRQHQWTGPSPQEMESALWWIIDPPHVTILMSVKEWNARRFETLGRFMANTG